MPRSDAARTIADLSIGNSGAVVVLRTVYRDLGESQFSTLVHGLRQLDFSGPQIYVCWADYAGRDLYKFFEGVRTKDPEMIRIATPYKRRA